MTEVCSPPPLYEEINDLKTSYYEIPLKCKMTKPPLPPLPDEAPSSIPLSFDLTACSAYAAFSDCKGGESVDSRKENDYEIIFK